MKSEEQIRKRIAELKQNKFYRLNAGSQSLKREIKAAIDELEWVLGEEHGKML